MLLNAYPCLIVFVSLCPDLLCSLSTLVSCLHCPAVYLGAKLFPYYELHVHGPLGTAPAAVHTLSHPSDWLHVLSHEITVQSPHSWSSHSAVSSASSCLHRSCAHSQPHTACNCSVQSVDTDSSPHPSLLQAPWLPSSSWQTQLYMRLLSLFTMSLNLWFVGRLSVSICEEPAPKPPRQGLVRV